jgi:hypothetical protein
MYIQPELGLRLARTTIEEARSRTQRAATLGAATPERAIPGVTKSTRRDRWQRRGWR